jgi:hypothetical protein
MTIWELLSTTEDRVLTWQPATWQCLGADSRQIYWGDQQGQHRASAAFDAEGEVQVLELTIPPKIWLSAGIREQWLREAQSLGLSTPPEILDNNTALRLFLETVQ